MAGRTSTRRARGCALTLVAGITLLGAGGAAHASRQQDSILQDDPRLIGGTNDVRTATLDELDRLGVDIVKAIVNWRAIAPAGSSRPGGFAADDPASYSAERWAPYDDLVRKAEARGRDGHGGGRQRDVEDEQPALGRRRLGVPDRHRGAQRD